MTTRMVRKYGKPVKKTRAELLFAELPKSPLKDADKSITQPVQIGQPKPEDPERETAIRENQEIKALARRLKTVVIADSEDEAETDTEPQKSVISSPEIGDEDSGITPPTSIDEPESPLKPPISHSEPLSPRPSEPLQGVPDSYLEEDGNEDEDDCSGTSSSLRILTWDDVCPPGDAIQKIAEASYAEVYRITNNLGTSIIKVIRLPSPIKPQTKIQQRSGLVDEEPHDEESLAGELQISEWLADVPGFVVYKERHVVQGKAPKALLETHQAFHRKMKRKDPDRLQFYPSPSRYLDETRFLVVELGDAGTALEDFVLEDVDQVWDIFLHTAIALARAEELIQFEVCEFTSVS